MEWKQGRILWRTLGRALCRWGGGGGMKYGGVALRGWLAGGGCGGGHLARAAPRTNQTRQ
jgi:hypothetical protein